VLQTLGFSGSGKYLINDTDSVKAEIYLQHSTITQLNALDDLFRFDIKSVLTAMWLEDIRHNLSFDLQFNSDQIYHKYVKLEAADSFKYDKYDIALALKQEDIKTNVNMQVSFPIDEQNTIRAKYAPEVNFPGFDEIYGPDKYVLINPGLKSSSTWLNLVFGADHSFTQELQGSADFFIRRTDRFLSWADPGNNNLWVPVNVPDVMNWGAVLDVRWAINSEMSQKFDYEFTQSRDMLNANLHVLFQPVHKLSLKWQYQPEPWKFEAGLNVVGSEYYRQDNDDQLKAYCLGSVKVSRNLTRDMTVFLDIDNIFNSAYRVWPNYPQTGTTFFLGAMIKIN
jgi:outer membrane receptor protein involved in Fe transport